MNVQKFLMFMAVVLIAGAAQGQNLLSNGDFEADVGLVPVAGNTSSASPTDWTYGQSGSYTVDAWLMNVSAIGDGSGGDVGVVFPNYNDDGGWNAVLQTETFVLIQPGIYTWTQVGAVDEADSTAWCEMELWWTDDPSDPWAGDYGWMPDGNNWFDLGYSSPLAANTWRSNTTTHIVSAGDPAVGNYLGPWIFGSSYDGRVILGESSITYEVPEPITLGLLGLGGLGLIRRRRRV